MNGQTWDFRVRSFSGERFRLEVALRGERALRNELDAIRECGRTATVKALSAYGREAIRRAILEPYNDILRQA